MLFALFWYGEARVGVAGGAFCRAVGDGLNCLVAGEGLAVVGGTQQSPVWTPTGPVMFFSSTQSGTRDTGGEGAAGVRRPAGRPGPG